MKKIYALLFCVLLPAFAAAGVEGTAQDSNTWLVVLYIALAFIPLTFLFFFVFRWEQLRDKLNKRAKMEVVPVSRTPNIFLAAILAVLATASFFMSDHFSTWQAGSGELLAFVNAYTLVLVPLLYLLGLLLIFVLGDKKVSLKEGAFKALYYGISSAFLVSTAIMLVVLALFALRIAVIVVGLFLVLFGLYKMINKPKNRD